LARLLPKFQKDETMSSEKLSEIFSSFANLRQPRTAALVKGARAQGESRVIDGGKEACLQRDERLRKGWEDESAVEAKYDALFREPY
jgi:salicylate hydroxylase